MPTLKETILLWLIVGIGLIYSAICTTLFFRVLEVAVSEGYGVKEGREEENEKRGKLRVLKGLSWSGMVSFFNLLFSGKKGIDVERERERMKYRLGWCCYWEVRVGCSCFT